MGIGETGAEIERIKELEEKVMVYEQLLHDIHLRVRLRNPNMIEPLIENICEWSEAHRREGTDEDIDKAVRSAFLQLRRISSDKL